MSCLKVSDKCEGCPYYRNKVRECQLKNVIQNLLNRQQAEDTLWLIKVLANDL
jgi:hypothetical protein